MKIPILTLTLLLIIRSSNTAEINKYIAAEEIDWNYAPSGANECTGVSGFSPLARTWTVDGVGLVYKKAKFFEYKDSSFAEKVEIPPEETHLGLLGPLIRAAPGDSITVTLKNSLDFPINIEPTGLVILANNVSAPVVPTTEAGNTTTYRWLVPQQAAPTDSEPDTKFYVYRSSVYPEKSDNAGLLGPILISKPNTAVENTGRDIITFMQIIDENTSQYYEENLASKNISASSVDELLMEGLMKHAVNGYLFCNTPGLEMTQGESVRWHLAAIGSESDMHTTHWHGNTFLENGHRADQVLLIPGSAHSLQFQPRINGTWLLHCHVNDHIHAGMMALYKINSAPAPTASNSIKQEATTTIEVPANSTARRYYIAAEEVAWDYTPRGGDVCRGAALAAENGAFNPQSIPTADWSDTALEFVSNSTGKVGSTYLKAVYIEYTDATFTKKKLRSPAESYMGLLGPAIKAEVGDTISITFYNKLNKSVSMHPHGVAYNKSSEGAPYNDGSSSAENGDDAVPSGSKYEYIWTVPETAGPGPNDPSTIGWMYHSHTDEVSDPYAGLIGALIIGRKGAFTRVAGDQLGSASDVDTEAVMLFGVMNERQSFLWPKNKNLLAQGGDPAAATASAPSPGRRMLLQSSDGSSSSETTPMTSTEGEMAEEDLMHAINGYMYCNAPVLSVPHGGTLRLHVIAIGTEIDLHTPSLMGSFVHNDNDQTAAALAVLPGVMTTADVKINQPAGPAVMQCRVADHLGAGMQALINVVDNSTAAAAAAVVRKETGVPPRKYYIAAEETYWNYAPAFKNLCGAVPRDFNDEESIFTEKYSNTIGSGYTKAMYRRYASSEFSNRIAVPKHQGLLGPLIACEEGDVIHVTFKNSLTFPVNIELDGGFVPLAGSYNKSEVAPGETVEYKWLVPSFATSSNTTSNSGPEIIGPSDDLSTIAFGYTSSVDYITHPMSGLVGMVVIGRKGVFSGTDPENMPAVPVPEGVDDVLPLLAAIMNENESPYLEGNLERSKVSPTVIAAAQAAGEGEGSRRRLLDESGAAGESSSSSASGDFYESNLKHSLNGFMYCNMPDFKVASNKTLRVMVLTVGSEADLHTIQFAGQILKTSASDNYKAAVEPLMPAMAQTADLVPTQSGRWPISCAVHDHIEGGMEAMLMVDGDSTRTTSSSAVSVSSSLLSLLVAAVASVLLMF